MHTIDRVQFKTDVTGGDGPVVVKFTAAWCGPCRAVQPQLDALARRWEGIVRFVAVDVDASPELAAQYHVQSVPTMALFESGQVRAVARGALSAAQIERALGLGEYGESGPLPQPEGRVRRWLHGA